MSKKESAAGDIFDLGIQELQTLYRAKKISPEEVVNQHIEQIEKVNPKINAVCERNFEEARKMAKLQSENFSKISEMPLFGTPFSVKEMIALEGFKLTAGSIHRRDYVSSKTATVVQRCIDAGAIPLVTTNVPEVGFWWETHNGIYGRTNNPYDTTRTSGGSSGGEAAIISSRGTFFGIGSDIGGSIRNPAGFCGIVGHKPTNRMLPLTGHFMQDIPEFADQDGNKYPYVSVGPMARKASDISLLLDIMSGPDGTDPEVKEKVKLKPLLQDLSKLKVYVLDSPVYHLTSPTTDEISQAVRTTAELFEQYGARVEKLPARILKNAVDYWFACLSSTESRPIFEEVLTSGGKMDLAKQMLNRFLGKEDYTLPSLIFVMLERMALLHGREAQVFKEAQEMKSYFQKLLGEDAILILPSMPYVAPLHRKALLSPFDFIYCGIFNAFQFPATVMPVKLNTDGLPVAVQIVAGPWQDHLCLSAAVAIEKTFGNVARP